MGLENLIIVRHIKKLEGVLPFSKATVLEINPNQLNPIHTLTHCFCEVLVQL
jgi:hypothetical protein